MKHHHKHKSHESVQMPLAPQFSLQGPGNDAMQERYHLHSRKLDRAKKKFEKLNLPPFPLDEEESEKPLPEAAPKATQPVPTKKPSVTKPASKKTSPVAEIPNEVTPPASMDDLLNQSVDPTKKRWRKMTKMEAEHHRGEDSLLPTPDFLGIEPQPGEEGYVQEVGGELFVYGEGIGDSSASEMVGPNATQFFSRAFTEKNSEDQEEVAVLNPDGTRSTIPSNENGMAELPDGGFGFETNKRNDVSQNGQAQNDQFGTPDSIARVLNIAADYKTLEPDSNLKIGDLSDETGGSPYLYNDRPDRHHSHYNGTQVDLQYAEGTGGTNRAPTSASDLSKEQALITMAEMEGMNNFYMAPGLSSKLDFDPDVSVHENGDHANHLHMGHGKGTP